MLRVSLTRFMLETLVMTVKAVDNKIQKFDFMKGGF